MANGHRPSLVRPGARAQAPLAGAGDHCESCRDDRFPKRDARAPHRARHGAVRIALAGLLLLVAHTPARAHARLERSTPAPGAVLATPPATVELWFNELLDDEFGDVVVFRARPDGAPADDANLATGKPHLDDADRTHLTTPLGALPPGAYVIQWKVLSRDGHSARGRILFRVGAAE